MTKFIRKWHFLFLLLCAVQFGTPANAQQAVWDPEEIARLAEKSARMAEAMSRAVELLNNINDLSRTIGRFGALSNLDFTRFDTLAGLKGAGPEIGSLASNIGASQHAKITSFSEASTFVHQLTSIPSGSSQVTGTGQVRQAFDALYRKALEDGYAFSTHARESASVAPQRAALLVAQASATADLRGDVGANTAVTMAVLDQLGSLKATLGSILEIQAVQRLVLPLNISISK